VCGPYPSFFEVEEVVLAAVFVALPTRFVRGDLREFGDIHTAISTTWARNIFDPSQSISAPPTEAVGMLRRHGDLYNACIVRIVPPSLQNVLK